MPIKDLYVRWCLHAKHTSSSIKNRSITSAQELQKKQQELEVAGAFIVKLVKKTFNDTDGTTQTVFIPRAAETDMWPMGTHAWVRDMALGADRLLQVAHSTGNASQLTEGKQLLLSALTLMSTQAQLERFTAIISSENRFFKAKAANWPYIFMAISNNLTAQQTEPWAHKQDAWQALAVCTFRALQAKQINPEDLTTSHKQFLALSAPFLVAVEYWQQENSGSWEELEALRTSVLSWDTALLQEYIWQLEAEDSWLLPIAQPIWQTLPVFIEYDSIQECCAEFLKKGAAVLAIQLPHESPQYPESDPRYRKADAALLYVLHNNTLQLVADYCGKDEGWIQDQEQAIVAAVTSLQDVKQGGIARYKDDSYQRIGFFRPSIVKKLRRYYGSQSGDTSGIEDFVQRGVIVPSGKEALWTHFVWQLTWWSALRFLQTGNIYYKQIAVEQFSKGIGLITVKNMYSLDVTSKGKVHIIAIQPNLIPECYLTESWRGKEYMFPSAHTPLNWSIRESQLAFATMQQVFSRS